MRLRNNEESDFVNVLDGVEKNAENQEIESVRRRILELLERYK